MIATLLIALAQADRLEQAYERSLARIARAKSLYVRLDDAIGKQIREVWLAKPNRIRMVAGGRLILVCDGKSEWRRERSQWRRGPAPRGFPDDLELYGFEPFFDPAQSPGDYFGPGVFSYKGKRYRSINIKTTEAAIIYGMTYFDRRSLLPLGHRRTEYAEVADLRRYLSVRLDPPMPANVFAPPD